MVGWSVTGAGDMKRDIKYNTPCIKLWIDTLYKTFAEMITQKIIGWIG